MEPDSFPNAALGFEVAHAGYGDRLNFKSNHCNTLGGFFEGVTGAYSPAPINLVEG